VGGRLAKFERQSPSQVPPPFVGIHRQATRSDAQISKNQAGIG